MGSGGMATVLRNNKIMKRDRVSIYDKKHRVGSAPYQELVDHKSMKTWEYAAFQKKQFEKKRRERRKRYIIFIISAILSVLVLILIFSTVQHLFFQN